MNALNRLLLTSILFFISINLAQAQTETKSWEVHLNLRGINGLLNGENGSFLVKKRISEDTYARLGLQGYRLTRKQTGVLGNNILIKQFVLQIRPGLESRTAINGKFYFLYGADLIYTYSGTDSIPPVTNQYTEKQRNHDIGLSPFVGIHYTINSHFGILAEAHLDAFAQFIRNEINNDAGSSQPNRTETRTDTLIEFQPFQNITVCFTF